MTTSTPISSKQQFLNSYEREHEITMRVLRAYPEDKIELRPHPRTKSARELAWIFVLERGMGKRVYNNEFATRGPGDKSPSAPESWNEILSALEKTHKDFGDFLRAAPEEELSETVKFFNGPGSIGDVRRIDFLWFLLSDQIHHRGQFSVYLRMAGGKVPSIYGPSADEPWT